MDALADNTFSQVSRNDLINIFKFYDTDNSGKLFKETIKAIMNKHPSGITDEEIESVLAPLTDKEGFVNYFHLVHRIIPA
jgi:Ca2+-binding EF-hand superfamily protein